MSSDPSERAPTSASALPTTTDVHDRPVEPVSIEIVDLDLRAGDQVLLEAANATFAAGKINLIVGPSGVGKSILLRLIAGLTENFGDAIQYDGKVLIDDEPAASGMAGVVFQSFALFDEFSPVDNLKFAQAVGDWATPSATAKATLADLNVPTGVPTARLSGGQRQRLAIARTLAYNPPVILYDEPTSGLDPSTGKRIAGLIKTTGETHHKTSLIVTHDYACLIPVADEIYLLDPAAKKLERVPPDQWDAIPTRLDPMAQVASRDSVPPQPTLIQRVINLGEQVLVETANVVTTALAGLIALFPRWKSPAWGLRFFAHYLRMISGPTAMVYLMASGLISGFVTTFFVFKFLPLADYTEPLVQEDLLTGLGFATYRIFVPVLSCVLIAARCGAAVTAEIGGRQYGNQIDALRTIGARPNAWLLTPIVWSFLIATPVLTLLAWYVARYASMFSFLATHPDRGPDFWHFHFHRGLESHGHFFYYGSQWLFAKLLCSGFGVAIISYLQGMKPKFSSNDVSRSVTSTILWATLFVLAVHFVFALFEYQNIVPGGR